MEQFLHALQDEEATRGADDRRPAAPRLSSLMRDSWRSGRFWFDYAARKIFDLDAVYWAALHGGAGGAELLGDEAQAEMGSFTDMKMEQLRCYNEECAARFSQASA